MILTICINTVAVALSMCFCSFMEWFVHGPLMHGKLATKFLRGTHEDHHRPASYKSEEHSVRLPWWAPVVMLMPVAILTSIVGWFISHWEVAVLSILTSLCYYTAYQYVHMCLHERPDGVKKRWIKSTKWFARRDMTHRIHHAHEVDFDRPVNLGILTSFWDRFIGTYRSSEATKREVLC